MADMCDLAVHLPLERELCPFDLAPVTSTAIQMLFGDTVAIALMQVHLSYKMPYLSAHLNIPKPTQSVPYARHLTSFGQFQHEVYALSQVMPVQISMPRWWNTAQLARDGMIRGFLTDVCSANTEDNWTDEAQDIKMCNAVCL